MRLTTDQLALVEARIANEQKSALVAYLLWFFGGALGIHMFYLGKWVRGLLILLLFCLTLISLGGTISAGPKACPDCGKVVTAFLIPWAFLILFDLFAIPSYIRRHREALRQKLQTELAVATQARATAA